MTSCRTSWSFLQREDSVWKSVNPKSTDWPNEHVVNENAPKVDAKSCGNMKAGETGWLKAWQWHGK